MHPPRCESIGCRSAPYGPARVEIRDAAGALVAEALTNTCNHCAISGLSPNTRYTYTVTVKHEVWGQGVRWDWDPQLQGLAQRDREYRNEFRTLPDPQAPLDEPFSFIVIGDFGTGIRKPSSGRAPSVRGRPGARARRRSVRRAADADDRRQHLRGQALPAVDGGLGRRRRRLVLHVLSAISLRAEPDSRCARRSATTTRARPRSTTTASR